jgi:hypothetical protein
MLNLPPQPPKLNPKPCSIATNADPQVLLPQPPCLLPPLAFPFHTPRSRTGTGGGICKGRCRDKGRKRCMRNGGSGKPTEQGGGGNGKTHQLCFYCDKCNCICLCSDICCAGVPSLRLLPLLKSPFLSLSLAPAPHSQ